MLERRVSKMLFIGKMKVSLVRRHTSITTRYRRRWKLRMWNSKMLVCSGESLHIDTEMNEISRMSDMLCVRFYSKQEHFQRVQDFNTSMSRWGVENVFENKLEYNATYKWGSYIHNPDIKWKYFLLETSTTESRSHEYHIPKFSNSQKFSSQFSSFSIYIDVSNI